MESLEVDENILNSLNEILYNFDVTPEVRKALGTLSHSLSPLHDLILSSRSSNDDMKEDMKKKKMKKLEELKKRKV